VRRLSCVIMLSGLVEALAWVLESRQAEGGGTLAVAGTVLTAALGRLIVPERRADRPAARRQLADATVQAAVAIGTQAAGPLPAQS
jgi:hypothetical protein